MTALLEQVYAILPPTTHGWCTKEKATKLVSTILETKPDLCVEIGTFGGASLIPQAMALQHNKKGKIYGIDPWTQDAALDEMTCKDNREWWAALNLEEIYQHCLTQIRIHGLDKICELLRAKSEDVVSQFKENSIDLLHIDGNHSELHSFRDAQNYLPKVKPGGYIFFDDIWWTEGDQKVTTRKAIVYLFEYCTRVDLVSDCLVFKKN